MYLFLSRHNLILLHQKKSPIASTVPVAESILINIIRIVIGKYIFSPAKAIKAIVPRFMINPIKRIINTEYSEKCYHVALFARSAAVFIVFPFKVNSQQEFIC